MKLYSTLVILSLLTNSAFGAESGWKDREGNILPDAPDQKSIGDFGAWLILVDDEEQFLETWETPSEVVNIDSVSRIERDKILTALVIFSGCEANPKSGCDIAGGFEVIQPDGKTYASIEPHRVWPPNIHPDEGALVMSQSYLRVRIEPGEQLGNYTIRATLADLVAGRELLLESVFEAYESAP